MLSLRAMQQEQTETEEVLFEHQEAPFHCEGDWALRQVAQGGCEVSLLGATEKPSGHGSRSPWAARLHPMTFRSPFQTQRSVILWFITIEFAFSKV